MKQFKSMYKTLGICKRLATTAATTAPKKSVGHGDIIGHSLANGAKISQLTNNKLGPALLLATWSAGSSHELMSLNELGMNHLLRRSFGLATNNYSSVNLTRSLQQMGAAVSVDGSRETFSAAFQLENTRWLSEVSRILSEAVCQPQFYHYELKENAYISMMNDIDVLKRRNPQLQMVELLHSAAFGNQGLGNSLYAPDFMEGFAEVVGTPTYPPELEHDYYTAADINGFLERNITPQRLSLTLVNCGGGQVDDIREQVSSGVLFPKASVVSVQEKSSPSCIAPPANSNVDFMSGDLRRELPLFERAHVAMVWKAPALGDDKHATMQILATALGNWQGRSSPRVSHSAQVGGVLQADVCAEGDAWSDNLVSAIYWPYSSVGVAGFHLSSADTTSKLSATVETLHKRMKLLAKDGLTQSQFNNAKQCCKNNILFENESCLGEAANINRSLLANAKAITTEERLAALDKVTLADVKQVAQSTFSGKAAMSAVGDIAGLVALSQLQ